LLLDGLWGVWRFCAVAMVFYMLAIVGSKWFLGRRSARPLGLRIEANGLDFIVKRI
jgi:hypothetical protein